MLSTDRSERRSKYTTTPCYPRNREVDLIISNHEGAEVQSIDPRITNAGLGRGKKGSTGKKKGGDRDHLSPTVMDVKRTSCPSSKSNSASYESTPFHHSHEIHNDHHHNDHHHHDHHNNKSLGSKDKL